MHADELSVAEGTVRELVSAQFPQWTGHAIRRVDSEGTVNALFRIGEQLVARLPLRPADAGSARRWLEAEARAARELLGRTRFATPRPIAHGEPGAGYPMPWAVQTWILGATASRADPSGSVAFAHDLAEFIQDVRAIDTGGRTFTGTSRGGDLHAHDEWMHTCLQRSQALLDMSLVRDLWRRLRDLLVVPPTSWPTPT